MSCDGSCQFGDSVGTNSSAIGCEEGGPEIRRNYSTCVVCSVYQLPKIKRISRCSGLLVHDLEGLVHVHMGEVAICTWLGELGQVGISCNT